MFFSVVIIVIFAHSNITIICNIEIGFFLSKIYINERCDKCDSYAVPGSNPVSLNMLIKDCVGDTV